MSAHAPIKTPAPEDVERLHAAGESRNGVARALDVSTRQVDRVAAELGLSWSPESTQAAVKARAAVVDIDRLELAEKFRELALDSLLRALDEDDGGERRRFAMTAESASRSDLRIWAEREEAEEANPVEGMFSEMLTVLRNRYAVDETAEEDLTCDYCQLVECTCGGDDDDGDDD